MVFWSWLWLLLECVLMAGWFTDWTLAGWGCKPAINNTLYKHPPHIPNTKLRLGILPRLLPPPHPPSKQTEKKKKKTHTGLWTGLPYLQKKRTLYRVSIPKQKINTTPPTTLPSLLAGFWKRLFIHLFSPAVSMYKTACLSFWAPYHLWWWYLAAWHIIHLMFHFCSREALGSFSLVIHLFPPWQKNTLHEPSDPAG